MGTWTVIYIESNDTERVVDLCRNLSGIENVYEGPYEDVMYFPYLEHGPGGIALARQQDDWITMDHNHGYKLENWAQVISEKLKCRFVQVAVQTTIDYYCFMLYDKGIKVREIEYDWQEHKAPVFYGKRLDFETTEYVASMNKHGYTSFGSYEIEKYCERLGVILNRNYQDFKWTILKAPIKQMSFTEHCLKCIVKFLRLFHKEK